MNEYFYIGVFALLGLLYGGGALLASRLFAPRGEDKGRKLEPYESGEANIGPAKMQFRLGYYLFALVFLIFDVEALFLFPVVRVFRAAVDGKVPGLSAALVFFEVALFVLILVLALVYARRKRALEWD
jgi:NADH:ubiquinone oxidoreductase subunit 3 (subunit A)